MAPDFAEVEENVEYIEREDEFDIHPIEEIHKRRLDLEDEIVDVLTIEPAKSEHEEEAFSMPVVLGIIDSESEEDIVAIGPGTMRRRDAAEDWMNGVHSGESGDDRGASRRTATNGTAIGSTRSRRR